MTLCKECGREFYSVRSTAVFCSPRCRVRWNRREDGVKESGVKARVFRENTRSGYVYVIGAGGYTKIGITCKSVESRLQSMQTGCPLEMAILFQIRHIDIEGAERRLHSLFSRSRVRGEWFSLDHTDMCRLIEELGKEAVMSREFEVERDTAKIHAETYDVPMITEDYDADDIRELRRAAGSFKRVG